MGCFIPETANRPILDALDLTGWNYLRRYSIYRQRYPHKPIVYSESASALSTRGFYEVPLAAFKTDYSDQRQVCSYDLNAAPWADIPDVEFALMEKDRFVAGEFVWTGFDYLGRRHRLIRRHAVRILGSWICAASPKTDFICIAATGGLKRRRCIFCRIGTGPIGLAKMYRYLFIPTAMKRSCF